VSGWTGSGYVILDSGSGDSAWKISGGQYGEFASTALSLFSLLILFVGPLDIGAFVLGLVTFVSIALSTINMLNSLECAADGVLAINLSVAIFFAVFKAPKFTAQGWVGALIKFITKGETSLVNSACR
jgi:hypothetical protein